MRQLVLPILFAAALSAPARADVTAAARAFADGQAAQLEGDHARAAQSFELAYTIQPSKEALRSAVRARQQNGQLSRAATLAEELEAKYPEDEASMKLASEILTEARPKLGRVTVACTPACSLALDGRALSLVAAEKHIFYVNPGSQSLDASFEKGGTATRTITPEAGADLTVELVRPADLPPPKPFGSDPPKKELPPRPIERDVAESHGISPVVTFVGAGVTIVLGAVAIWSGVDTVSAHDAYVAMPTQAGWDDGRAKQLRTNLLWAGTAAAGVSTALIAVFWTDWKGHGAEPPVAVAPVAEGGLSVSFHGSF